MIAADADGVPARQVLATVAEHIGDDAHRVPRRVNIGATRDVFLQNIVLHSTGELANFYSLFFGDSNVERQENTGCGIDGHGCADPIKGQAIKQGLHIFQAGDGDPNLAHFTLRYGIIGVIAHLGRKIEGHGKASCALREEEVIAFIRLFRRGETSVLAHSPEARTIH